MLGGSGRRAGIEEVNFMPLRASFAKTGQLEVSQVRDLTKYDKE